MPNRYRSLFLSAIAATLLCGMVARADATQTAVNCHVSYGGETRLIRADPTIDPYSVAPTAVGSYFLFRIVFEHPQRKLPGIKLYTYADQEGGPVPIHVAHFPFPPAAASPRRSSRQFGFTGEQIVYEPVRDGELHYWCELVRTAKRQRPP